MELSRFFCQPTVTQYEAAYTTTYIEERKSPPRHLGVAFTAAQHHQPPPSLSLDIKGDTYGHHSLNISERKRPWKAELCYAAALITQRVIQSPPSIYPEKRDMTHKAAAFLASRREELVKRSRDGGSYGNWSPTSTAWLGSPIHTKPEAKVVYLVCVDT